MSDSNARPRDGISHDKAEKQLKRVMDWPQYYVSGEGVDEAMSTVANVCDRREWYAERAELGVPADG